MKKIVYAIILIVIIILALVKIFSVTTITVENSRPLEINENGNTPLFYAIEEENMNDIITIVENGTDVNHVNNFGGYPLELAVMKDNLEIVTYLIDKHAKVINEEQMLIELQDVSKDIEKVIMKQIEQQNNQEQNGEENEDVFQQFTTKDELVTILENDSSLLNVRNEYGNTLLHEAAKQNCVDCIEYLLEQGVNINIENSFGETAAELTQSPKIKEMLND